MILNVTIPLDLGRGQNNREHWRTTNARADKEKAATTKAVLAALAAQGLTGFTSLGPTTGMRVTFLRPFHAGHPLDTDNLSGSFKYPRDAVARCFGFDDATDRIFWRYVQCKGDKKRDDGMYARCRVEIVPASDVDPMVTAVRRLGEAALRVTRSDPLNLEQPDAGLMVVGGFALSELAKAIATAEALSFFDPMEMYR